MGALQAPALPLGYATVKRLRIMREKGDMVNLRELFRLRLLVLVI